VTNSNFASDHPVTSPSTLANASYESIVYSPLTTHHSPSRYPAIPLSRHFAIASSHYFTNCVLPLALPGISNITDNLYSCRFGTFLSNCFLDREKHLNASTLSIWRWVEQNYARFLNPDYAEYR
jgi:hypothetical protein